MGFLIKCPICGGDFKDGRAYTVTSGVAFAPGHHLYGFCDGGLHLDCLATWPYRAEFSRGYFDGPRQECASRLTVLAEGSGWFLGCGPAKLADDPYYAAVWLSDWPIRLYTRFGEWAKFLRSGYAEGLVGPALESAAQAMAQVRQIAPDLESLRKLRHQKMITNTA